MKIFKEFNRRRGISDKVRRVEESSSHVTRRGEEGTKLQARDLDSLLGNIQIIRRPGHVMMSARCLHDLRDFLEAMLDVSRVKSGSGFPDHFGFGTNKKAVFRIPESGFFPIPDPGSRIPDPGSNRKRGGKIFFLKSV